MADTPDQFQPHEDFPELIEDTRAPALPVGAPAITRLVAFWKPDGLTREKWAEQIENFILEVYDRQVAAGNPPITPNMKNDGHGNPERFYLLERHCSPDPKGRTFDPIRKPSRRHQSVRMGLTWEGAPVLLNFELDDEFFMLSSSIDLSKTSPPQLGPNARNLADDMGAFSAGVEERYQALIKGQPENTVSGISKDVNSTIYETTLKALEKALFAKAIKAVGQETLGGYFADFRSCVAALEKLEHKGRTVLPGHAATPEHYTAAPQPFDSLESYTYAKTLLPFMTQQSRTAAEDDEYTFSTILDEQGLLATALGVTVASKKVPTQTELFVVTRDRRWQIGRMIDRGHHMGVLRLAALHNLKHLNVADGKLQELEKALQKIAEALSKPVNEKEHSGHIKGLSADLLNVSQKLAEAGTGIEGGLANRLARSQIYQQEFAKLVEEMRIGRIDGFQPYDQFVRRLLGANYDFINTLNQRHGRIQEQISSLGRQLRTAQGLQLQEQIAGQTVAIQEHMGQLTRFNDIIRKVQVEGVKFLVPPLTYYAAHYIIEWFDSTYLHDNPRYKWTILAATPLATIAFIYQTPLISAFKSAGKFVGQKTCQAASATKGAAIFAGQGTYQAAGAAWRNKGIIKRVPGAIWRQLSKSTTWPTP